MENKFKNGDIVRVTNDKGSLKWVGKYVVSCFTIIYQ